MNPDASGPAGDAEAARVLTGTAQVLAGLLTLGLLEHAGGPGGLYATLFPNTTGEQRDRALFLAGAVTGAGVARRLRGRGGWSRTELDAARQVLADAGYTAMARLPAAAAADAPRAA